MIRISIVTISYNQAQFLPVSMASIGRQLGPRDEHIIVDPGSRDNSRQFIAAQAQKESRCRALLEKDLGPADGLNKGFGAAAGDVLAYVNADDWLLPGALDFARQHFMRYPNSDVLIGAIKLADEHGRMSWRGRVADRPTPSRLASGVCQYYQQGTFFRRSAFLRTSGFNLENRTCWDREIMVDLAIASARFHVTSQPLGVFRIHSQSITGAAKNSAAYAADTGRIQQKAAAAFGRTSIILTCLLAMEARFNPWRWILQMRPVSTQ